MNLWQRFEKKHCSLENGGLSFRFEKGLDPGLRRRYLDFAAWLRRNYVFPVHMHVYILDQEKVILSGGDSAYGSFRWYPNRTPRIKIPSKIEQGVLEKNTKDEAYELVLSSLVHELTHYFQWVLDLEQSDAVSERQANYFRFRIIDRFNAAQECPNPPHNTEDGSE